jgi:ppGpp synthetase/RelA/SpoT-type nucleotidyltranferase
VLYSESIEGHTVEEASTDSVDPTSVDLLSKTQVDRLGDRLRKGTVAEEDLQQLDTYRRSFSESYDEIVAVVRDATQLEPTGRPTKSTTSIIEKIRRETIRLSQMQDIAGCRVVVDNILVQDQVVERLKSALPKAIVVDRRKQPSFGYRAMHVIVTARNKPVEIQVRTELQHLWAQFSEKLSDVRDPGIKYGGGGTEIQQTLSSISTLIASLENVELNESVLESMLSDLQSQVSTRGLSEHKRLGPLIADVNAKRAESKGRLSDIKRQLCQLLENAIKSE